MTSADAHRPTVAECLADCWFSTMEDVSRGKADTSGTRIRKCCVWVKRGETQRRIGDGNLTKHFHISIVGLDELDELDVMSPWPWPFVLSKQSLCFTRQFLRKIWRICVMTARLGQEKCGVTVFRLKYDQEWRPES